jgi:hypothetical protein
MPHNVDKFRINWIEKSRDKISETDLVITSITGFDYQIDDWKREYNKKYPQNNFDTKILNTIPNSDGTKTVTFSRLDRPREEKISNVKSKNSRLQAF